VVVDEEHETSYKQYDPSPRYHARDTAIMLGHLHTSKTLLGSATPSIESYFNAASGKYALIELFARYAGIEPPEIILVDIKKLTLRKQMKSHFSPLLLDTMKEELDKGRQVILFQNRRGFAPVIQCNNCQWIPHCVNCDVSLTYYKKADMLRCHYCGYTANNPSKCGACGDTDLRQRGFGTEKIEDELQIFFPDKRIARLDLDSTRGKHAYKEIINSFEKRETDILVGTQMVTKGLDFDNVSLVGILNADNLVNFPDFRAYERSFQMLMQVSGRAGRKQQRGKVIIQSYNTEHSILQFVLNNNYKGFIDYEFAERQKFNYPPYFRLVEITMRCKNEMQLDDASQLLAKELKENFGKRVLGPVVPVVSRVKNYYLRTLLLKADKNIATHKTRMQVAKSFDFYRQNPISKNVFVSIDVDPA
jgi:primosomal protein N' (replication factor Y)